jgi:zinc/manganese transport system substrate-binding protein
MDVINRTPNEGRLTRRAVVLGLTGAAATVALAACGASPTATVAPTVAPTTAPTGAATATRPAAAAASAAASASAAPATPAAASPTAAATAIVAASPTLAATAIRAASPTVAATPVRQVNVVATTQFVQDFVRNVGGNRVALSGLLNSDADPHDYEPTVQDAQTVGKAEIIFVHGLDLDAWIEEVIKNANAKAPIVVATDGITALEGDPQEFPDGDPHVWFDPTLAQRMVTNIAEGLAKIDAAGAATYRQNAQAYNAQIAQMDTQVKGIIDGIPQANRKLVTNHDAFQYFAARFGLTVVGAVIPSQSDAAEPTAQEINELIETIKRERVKAIFAESQANPRVAQQVARETGIGIVDTLYADTFSAPGGPADTYLKLMVYDATTIANALK